MKISERDKAMKLKDKPSGSTNPHGRPRSPDSALTLAEKANMNPNTMASRMKKVRRGEMTLEEALTTPVRNRREIGKLAAKRRWREEQ